MIEDFTSQHAGASLGGSQTSLPEPLPWQPFLAAP